MTDESEEQLDRIWRQAETQPAVSPAELEQMCRSASADTRLLALLLMRRPWDEGELADEYFDLARSLIEDENNHCRWQAIIVIECFIEARPDDVWRIIEQYGVSDDDDMQAAIACILLEHILDTHFEQFFPALQNHILTGSARMAEALEMSALPGSKEHRRRIAKLLSRVNRTHLMLRDVDENADH